MITAFAELATSKCQHALVDWLVPFNPIYGLCYGTRSPDKSPMNRDRRDSKQRAYYFVDGTRSVPTTLG